MFPCQELIALAYLLVFSVMTRALSRAGVMPTRSDLRLTEVGSSLDSGLRYIDGSQVEVGLPVIPTR